MAKLPVTDPKAVATGLNAPRSTGPRTEMGKAVSSRNALKHGLLSREVLMPGEPQNDLDGLAERLRAVLNPVGELEELLVDRIVAAAWRLCRVLRVEVEQLEQGGLMFDGEQLGVGYAFGSLSLNGDRFSKLARYEASIDRGFYRALHELQRLQAARSGQVVMPPVAVDVVVSGGVANDDAH